MGRRGLQNCGTLVLSRMMFQRYGSPRVHRGLLRKLTGGATGAWDVPAVVASCDVNRGLVRAAVGRLSEVALRSS